MTKKLMGLVAGIAVILDVVFNHTGECDAFGPTLSMRGLDNAGFYRLQSGNPAHYVNDAGCGNVPAFERPMVMRLALEALRTASFVPESMASATISRPCSAAASQASIQITRCLRRSLRIHG